MNTENDAVISPQMGKRVFHYSPEVSFKISIAVHFIKYMNPWLFKVLALEWRLFLSNSLELFLDIYLQVTDASGTVKDVISYFQKLGVDFVMDQLLHFKQMREGEMAEVNKQTMIFVLEIF
ncbi:4-hydroxy-tetrahydrodipicolinate reductase 2, chloroplastic-like [Spinacia oleracea]|uniref:4-hydroxy-tetrahydrodipicolinate reductase 2, chloroplastic-like n=1 Tax=Spinacia oleracea TaxID=3562 RepID=A0ABM3QPJ9_SPIOL|nr:4-hydroxy-tetrahydrodipicolinate reductase 2, chloroplastic-like [Spinacia oleracea]